MDQVPEFIRLNNEYLGGAFAVTWMVVFCIAGVSALLRGFLPRLATLLLVDLIAIGQRLGVPVDRYVRQQLIYSLRAVRRRAVDAEGVYKALEIVEVPGALGALAEEAISETVGKWIAAEFEHLVTREDRVLFVQRVQAMFREQEKSRPRDLSESPKTPASS